MAMSERRVRPFPKQKKGAPMAPFSLRLLPCSAAEYRTAIHVEHFASNVARPVRAQEYDGVGDVVRQRDTLQRNRLLDFVLVSVGAGAKDGIIQLGVHPAGRYAIHADVGR